MLLGVIHSINNVSIRLTDERWLHIITAHPEIDSSEYASILDVIKTPDTIFAGDKGEYLAIRKKARKKVWFVVVYKEVTASDGFVVTAYITTDHQ